MSRQTGSANFAGTIEPLAGGPLDARTVVGTVADLTTSGTFPYPYEGMKVYCKEDKKTYKLIADDPTVSANWVEDGGSDSSVVEGYYYTGTEFTSLNGFIAKANEIYGWELPLFATDTTIGFALIRVSTSEPNKADLRYYGSCNNTIYFDATGVYSSPAAQSQYIYSANLTGSSSWTFVNTGSISTNHEAWSAMNALAYGPNVVVTDDYAYASVSNKLLSGYGFYADSSHITPITPEEGKLYVDLDGDNIYIWDGEKYVIKGGGGGASALTDLTDIDISSPSEAQVLTYDGTTEKWENRSIPDQTGNCYKTDGTISADLADPDYFPFYDVSETTKKSITWSNYKTKMREYVKETFFTDSTSEQEVGEFFGSTLYKKTFTGTLSSSTGTTTVSSSWGYRIVKYEGCAYNSSWNVPINATAGGGSSSMSIAPYVNSGKLLIANTNSAITGATYYLTVYYTK